MSLYKIEMKGKTHLVQARSREHAFKKVFKDVLTGDIPLSDVSLIMVCHDADDQYPMRLVPSLYACELLDFESAMATLQQAGIDITYREFMATVEKDKWLWDDSL